MIKHNIKKLLAIVLVVAVLVTSVSTAVISAFAADTKQTLNISVVTTDTSNDLLKTLQANYDGIKQYSSIANAVSNVDANGTDAIMVLAGAGVNYQYTNTSTDYITADVYKTLQDKGVRLYVEFPKNNSAIGITGYSQYGETDAVKNMSNEYRRAIVTSTGADNIDLAENTLLYAHGARYLKKLDTTNAWLTHAKVAGYDTVAYNDYTHANSEIRTFLETNENGDVLIAATKLSGFATGRYSPTNAWATLWRGILSWLTDGTTVTSFDYTPLMTAAYTKDATLPDTAYTDAVAANMQWYYDNMVPSVEGNDAGWGGFYQRYRSDAWGWQADGNQSLDNSVRADCTGESIGAMAIASVLLENEEYRQIAYNAMDWMLNESNMANGDRHSDPNNSQYGLLGWYDDWTDSKWTVNVNAYYGDDNAKAILGLILAASALETDEFDERILEAIMGNFRTTGTNGFRSAYFNGSSMNSDWKTYYNNASDEDLRAHFQALLWACYLWAYEKTGYEPLYERSENAISIMMTAYEDTVDGNKYDGNGGEWTWTNSLQADRAKMAWALSWLVRVSPTEEHIGWLNTMITDMMAFQDAETGAIGEDLDTSKGHGDCDAPESNAEYGTKEAPVIHNADDPATDLLYVSGFAHTALNEAVTALEAAGEDTATIEDYRNKLANFHVRIQQSSTSSKYNGAWFRGFDYDKWEVYGSAADSGWPVWDTETGWTNAQIASSLALQQMNSSIWDYSKSSTIGNCFEDTATLMLGSEYTAPTATITSNVTLRWGAEVLVDGNYADADATKWNSGKWTGAEGTDITLTLDYGQKKTFDNVTIGFDQYASLGAFLPESITVYTSDNGTDYTQVGKSETGIDIQAKYDAWYNNGTNDASQIKIERIKTQLDKTVSARYVKIVVKNPMQSYMGGTDRTTNIAKTWIFMDEIELGITSYTREQLKALIDSAKATNTAGKQVDSVLALDNALTEAESVYNSGSTTAAKLKSAYTALETALQGLKDAKAVSIYSNSATDSWANSPQNLLNGNYKDVAMTYKVLVNGAATEREVILDLGESTSVLAVGYAAQSRPTSGIYLQNATFYVADSTDSTSWTQVGYIGGAADSDGVYNTEEYQTLTAAANGSKGRYVKVVFSQCTDNVITNASEWLFLSEILINKFCPITLTAQNATVNMIDSDGNAVGALGAIYGKDVTFNITTDKNAILDTATVNGNAVTVQNNSFTISNVTSAQNVVVNYKAFADSDLPTITGMKDLYVAKDNALTFDPRIDLVATDKDGNDITSSVTYTSNIAASVGTYTVTFSVTAPNGATATATTNVHVLDSINPKYVVAATPSVDDIGSRNKMNKAQILVDGLYAPTGATHSNASFMPWKNTDNIEIVVALDGTTTISEIGYALGSMPSVGAYPPDVKFYTTSEIGVGKATVWTYAGKIEAELHEGDFATTQLVKKMLTIPTMTTGYVKVVICFDDSAEMLGNYSSTAGKGNPEWTFVDEIIIGSHYEIDESIEIAGMNVSYETDGTMSINIHCPNPQANEKLIVNNANGTESKYGTIVASSDTFVDSYFAGTSLPAGSKMYVLNGLSASDLSKGFTVTRVINDETSSAPQKFSLQSYFVNVVNGISTVYPDGATDAQKAADKKVAAAALNYGMAANTALSTKYEDKGEYITDTWDGSSNTNLTGSGTQADPYIIETAEQLFYVARKGGAETRGKYYKVADNVKAFYLNEGVTENTPYADAKATLTKSTALKWNGSGYFEGHFDGNGVIIAGMCSTDAAYAGLFGLISAPDGTGVRNVSFKNINLKNCYVNGNYRAAGIVAFSDYNCTASTLLVEKCSVVDCHIECGSAGGYGAGAIVGVISRDKLLIKDCFVNLDEEEFVSVCETNTSNTTIMHGGLVSAVQWGTVTQASAGTAGFVNCIVLGIKPYAINPNAGAVDMTDQNEHAFWGRSFKNVYTNTSGLPETSLNTDDRGGVILLSDDAFKGENVISNCPNLDWDTVWSAGLGESYPKVAPVKTTDSQSKKTVYWNSGNAASSFANGSGTETDPYIIASAEELALAVKQNAGSYYKVDESIGKIVLQTEANAQAVLNITSAENGKTVYEGLTNLKSWLTSDNGQFNGHFDGSGVEIYGLYRNEPTPGYNKHVALFPQAVSSSTFKNFAVKNSYIVSYGRVSAVVASVDAASNESTTNVTTKFENIEISNNYLATTRTDVVSILAMGRAAACISYDNLLVYGNRAYRCTTEKDISTLVDYNQLYYYVKNIYTAADDEANKFSNSIILGCSIVVSGQGNASAASNFKNIYTDSAIADIDAVSNSSAADFNGKIFTISLTDIIGDAAKENCKNLDWDTTWYAGNMFGYPSFNKVEGTLPSNIQGDYDGFTFMGKDNYKITDSNFGMYATSVNLKANPHIAFTFMFGGDYKANRDNITVTFTTASGKVITTTVGDGNGGVSAGWTNKDGAGRYHLYRLTDIPISDLLGEITVKVSYGGTDYDFGTFSVAGFARDMNTAYRNDPCAYYETRVEALKALLFYADAVKARYLA